MVRNSHRCLMDITVQALEYFQALGSVPASVRLYQFKITLKGSQRSLSIPAVASFFLARADNTGHKGDQPALPGIFAAFIGFKAIRRLLRLACAASSTAPCRRARSGSGWWPRWRACRNEARMDRLRADARARALLPTRKQPEAFVMCR